jgi:hypothetical protein
VPWGEKLSKFIPPEAIAKISWLDAGREWPKAVVLKPWKDGNNYTINFKSAAQGRQKLEAASIIGAWVSEAVDWEIIEELYGLRGASRQGGETVSLSAAGLSLPIEQFEPDGFHSVCQDMT